MTYLAVSALSHIGAVRDHHEDSLVAGPWTLCATVTESPQTLVFPLGTPLIVAVAGIQRLPEPVLAVEQGPQLRELAGHQGAGHLTPRVAAEPVGNRDNERGAEREHQRLRAFRDGGAQRPRPRHQAVLVVVPHRADVAQRGHG